MGGGNRSRGDPLDAGNPLTASGGHLDTTGARAGRHTTTVSVQDVEPAPSPATPGRDSFAKLGRWSRTVSPEA